MMGGDRPRNYTNQGARPQNKSQREDAGSKSMANQKFDALFGGSGGAKEETAAEANSSQTVD